MVDINPTKDAQSTADKVKAADKGGKGADDAYKALNTEVQSHYQQIGTGGYTQQDFQKYQDTLVKDLVKNGTLPDLSLEWAKDHKSVLNKLSGDDVEDGQVDKDGIKSGVDVLKGNTDGTLVQAFGAQLGDGGDVAGQHISGGTYDAAVRANGGDPSDGDTLDTSKTKYFDQETRAITNRGLVAKDGDKTTSKLSQLFEGNPPLIQQLDTAKDGGKADGSVSQDDLDTWLHSHGKDDPGYQVVKDIRDGKYNGQLKKDDGTDKISDGFSVKELSQDLGLPDKTGDIKDGKGYGDFAKSYRDARDGDPVPPPTVVKDASGKPTSISYDNGRVDNFEYDPSGNINRITETPPGGGDPVVYKANDKGVWGPVKADGTVDASGGQKNPVITEDGQYAFQGKDGKWNVADDHGNFTAPAADFSYKQGFPKLDKEGNPIPGQTQTSEVTVNPDSQITQITAPDGSTSKFTYDATDPSKLTALTAVDSKGNPEAFVRDASGKWVTAGADGKATTTAAPFTEAKIDSAGNVTMTQPDGSIIVSTPDNVNHKDTPDGPVVGADTSTATTTTPTGDPSTVKLPFDTATDANGQTTFKLEGGDGKWLYNYADQIAKADGKDTQAVLDEIVKANRGKNGLAADADGNNIGSYEKGDYIIPKDLLTPAAAATDVTTPTDATPVVTQPAGANPASNVTVTDGYVSGVNYANNSALTFTYDADHSLSAIKLTGVDGGAMNYTMKDGKWVDQTGKDAPFTNPAVKPDGTFAYTDADGNDTSITPDSKAA